MTNNDSQRIVAEEYAASNPVEFKDQLREIARSAANDVDECFHEEPGQTRACPQCVADEVLAALMPSITGVRDAARLDELTKRLIAAYANEAAEFAAIRRMAEEAKEDGGMIAPHHILSLLSSRDDDPCWTCDGRGCPDCLEPNATDVPRRCECPTPNPDCEHPTCPRYPQVGHAARHPMPGYDEGWLEGYAQGRDDEADGLPMRNLS